MSKILTFTEIFISESMPHLLAFNLSYVHGEETFGGNFFPLNVVGIATTYGLDDQEVGVRDSVGSRIFSSSRRPDRLWGPPNLLSNGYGG
jgi:hypothetical protein